MLVWAKAQSTKLSVVGLPLCFFGSVFHEDKLIQEVKAVEGCAHHGLSETTKN